MEDKQTHRLPSACIRRTRLYLPGIARPDAPTIIRAHDLRRSFQPSASGIRIDVLRGITLEIQPGEAVFLVGASGAGKTTLLYTLAGLEQPEGGSVVFEDQSVYDLSRRAQSRLRNARMGFIFQGYFLLPELTALENVLLPAMIGRHHRDRAAQAAASLHEVGLGERLHHLPLELSGGEQQRVAIARALINDPASSSPTNPPATSTARAAAPSSTCCWRSCAKSARRCSSSPTTWVWPARGDRTIEMRDGLLKKG